MKRDDERLGIDMPAAPIDRVVGPIGRFLSREAASGIVLLLCTAIALALSNSPWADGYLDFWTTPVRFEFGDRHVEHTLQHWINDGLMAVFFFVVGLEVKREVAHGELREMRRAVLPLMAALGGMLAPAAIYLLLVREEPAAHGWGIPMATDIAFVVGCMAVLGRRVPPSLRILLLTLAVADDIGAILVIAIGYSDGIDFVALGAGFAGIVTIAVLTRLGVRSYLVYVLLGFLVWVCFAASGVHATIAGVILGVLTPSGAYLGSTRVAVLIDRARDVFDAAGWDSLDRRAERVRALRQAARESISPLEYLESLLHPWVGFVIMPLFALANAGVPITAEGASDPVALAVAVALLVGKPLGILLFSFLAVRSGLAKLPEGIGWREITGAGLLAGIGFTMALFIAELAIEGSELDAAKVGILVGSAVAACLGMLVLATGTRGARVGK